MFLNVSLAGHIPNSVVRGQIGYTLPPDPIMNRALENMAFMAEMVCGTPSHMTSNKCLNHNLSVH